MHFSNEVGRLDWSLRSMPHSSGKSGIMTCRRLKRARGRIVFTPLGEGVTGRFDGDGFTGAAEGMFVNNWQRIA
jgi:hypothetical protein